jgi:hypothetical protein
MSREKIKEDLSRELDCMLDTMTKDCAALRKDLSSGLGRTLQNTWKLYLLLGKFQMLKELDFVDPESE